jgi:hypothetical protein
MARHDRKGRSLGNGRFVALPFEVLESSGYRAASVAARAVLVELAMTYHGANNGRLALSARHAADRCNMGKGTALRALQELEDCGLVECVEKGGFRDKRRLASEYRLLWLRCDRTGAIPARRYRLD